MRKIILVGLIGLLSLQLIACNFSRAGKCESIAIRNSFEKSNTENAEEEFEILTTFVSKNIGAQILAKEDDYIKNLSQFDYASKFKSNEMLDEKQRYEFYNKSTMEWEDSEKEKILNSVKFLVDRTENLKLNIPKEISFIKTDGKEEGGAAYTRGEYIIVTESDLSILTQKEMNYIVAHEFFHMYSRYNMDSKKDFYSVINFKETKALIYPSEIENLRISNPDAPITNYYIECEYKGQSYKFMPIIYAKEEFDSNYRDSFFDYMKEPLIAVDVVDMIATPIYKDGKPFIVNKADVSNFYEKTGENTYYTLHPEEIMADNFAFYVIESKVKSQWVIDGMLSVMKNIERQ